MVTSTNNIGDTPATVLERTQEPTPASLQRQQQQPQPADTSVASSSSGSSSAQPSSGSQKFLRPMYNTISGNGNTPGSKDWASGVAGSLAETWKTFYKFTSTSRQSDSIIYAKPRKEAYLQNTRTYGTVSERPSRTGSVSGPWDGPNEQSGIKAGVPSQTDKKEDGNSHSTGASGGPLAPTSVTQAHAGSVASVSSMATVRAGSGTINIIGAPVTVVAPVPEAPAPASNQPVSGPSPPISPGAPNPFDTDSTGLPPLLPSVGSFGAGATTSDRSIIELWTMMALRYIMCGQLLFSPAKDRPRHTVLDIQGMFEDQWSWQIALDNPSSVIYGFKFTNSKVRAAPKPPPQSQTEHHHHHHHQKKKNDGGGINNTLGGYDGNAIKTAAPKPAVAAAKEKKKQIDKPQFSAKYLDPRGSIIVEPSSSEPSASPKKAIVEDSIPPPHSRENSSEDDIDDTVTFSSGSLVATPRARSEVQSVGSAASMVTAASRPAENSVGTRISAAVSREGSWTSKVGEEAFTQSTQSTQSTRSLVSTQSTMSTQSVHSAQTPMSSYCDALPPPAEPLSLDDDGSASPRTTGCLVDPPESPKVCSLDSSGSPRSGTPKLQSPQDSPKTASPQLASCGGDCNNDDVNEDDPPLMYLLFPTPQTEAAEPTGPANYIPCVGHSLTQMPFDDNTFDVVSAKSLWYFVRQDEWEDVLGEIYRVLRPGGYVEIVVSDYAIINGTPADEYWWSRLRASLEARSLDPYPSNKVAQRLYSAGFTGVSQSLITLPRSWGGQVGQLAEFLCMYYSDSLFRAFGGLTAQEYDLFKAQTRVPSADGYPAAQMLLAYAQKPLPEKAT